MSYYIFYFILFVQGGQRRGKDCLAGDGAEGGGREYETDGGEHNIHVLILKGEYPPPPLIFILTISLTSARDKFQDYFGLQYVSDL
jgi:hypothetical protein